MNPHPATTESTAQPAGSPPEGAVWVRLPRYIGDSLMIHRALEPLRAIGLPLVAWGPTAVVELFLGAKGFAAAVADPPDKPGALAMSRLLKRHGATASINLARSQRASLAAWLGGVALRVGWKEGLGSLFCNRSLAFKRLSGHQQERYAALLKEAFPVGPEPAFVPFEPRREAQEEAEGLLAGMPHGFVAFALGARSWSKQLGLDVWTGLGRALLERGESLVLLGAPGRDQEMAKALAKALAESPGSVSDLSGRAGLAVTAAVILRASGLAGNDSALCHLAAACGIPTVVAFGPTLPERTAPVGSWVQVVRREDLSCLGCQRGACHVPGHPCLDALPPADLVAALDQVRLRRP